MPITGRYREMVTASFDHVQYIPVLSREFGSVETDIRDKCRSNAGGDCDASPFDGAASGNSLNYDDYYARQVVGHNLTLPALVSRGGTGLEVCSVVSSDRLDHLIRRGVVALGKRALRLERRLLAMSWLVKTKEDGKTKGNACRKRPDAKPPQHTSTYR